MYTHSLDPIAFHILSWPVRWYGLAYVFSIVFAFWWGTRIIRQQDLKPITPTLLWDFMGPCIIGVILGGRLGQVLFYQFSYFWDHPFEILYIWKGGMSFHGGFLGVIVAVIWYTKKHHIPWKTFGDILAIITPIGLFFGRIANFINGELVGRVTDVPWAVIFPHYDSLPRHPSQLYEAGLEGALLWIIMMYTYNFKHPGQSIGVFLVSYGSLRTIGEIFREPEIISGFLMWGTTWGQWLSLPMILGGLGFVLWSRRGTQ